jgi:hypothetical protein
LKQTIYEPQPLIARNLLLELPFQTIRSLWNEYLVCPKFSIFSFENAEDWFKTAIGEIFGLVRILNSFMIAMVALQIFVTQGNKLGWTSSYALILAAVAVIFGILFVRTEGRTPAAFIDFTLFHNPTFTGVTFSNFLLNAASGTMIVSLELVQTGGNMTAQQAGMLTLGYAIAIIAFIRVGENCCSVLERANR